MLEAFIQPFEKAVVEWWKGWLKSWTEWNVEMDARKAGR